MNTRKTVYNKLFTEKTELAKHEVELANYDFSQYNKQADILFNSYKQDYTKNINLAKTALDSYAKKLYDLTIEMNKEFQDFNIKAKELGLSVKGSDKEKQYIEMVNIIQKRRESITEKQKSISAIM